MTECVNRGGITTKHRSPSGNADIYRCSAFGSCVLVETHIRNRQGQPFPVCSDICPSRSTVKPQDNVTLGEFEPLDLPERGSDRVVVTLAIGHQFRQLLDIARPTFVAYAAKCQADYREILLDTSDYPEGDKFRLSQLFDMGYREVLFVDADALIMPTAENLFELVPADAAVAIHDDTPFLKRRDWLDAEYRNLRDSQGWDLVTTTCYNTGFMLLRDRRAIESPLKPFPRSHTAEQSLINLQIARYGLKVHRLPRQWNEQWWFTGSLPERKGTRVYHWASAPNATRLKEMPARRDGKTPTQFMACANLGDVVRFDKCEVCGSDAGPKGVRVPIRACSVHGECSSSVFKQLRRDQPQVCNMACQQFVQKSELVQLALPVG